MDLCGEILIIRTAGQVLGFVIEVITFIIIIYITIIIVIVIVRIGEIINF